jgi:hypothetical protein
MHGPCFCSLILFRGGQSANSGELSMIFQPRDIQTAYSSPFLYLIKCWSNALQLFYVQFYIWNRTQAESGAFSAVRFQLLFNLQDLRDRQEIWRIPRTSFTVDACLVQASIDWCDHCRHNIFVALQYDAYATSNFSMIELTLQWKQKNLNERNNQQTIPIKFFFKLFLVLFYEIIFYIKCNNDDAGISGTRELYKFIRRFHLVPPKPSFNHLPPFR